jgi:hypothetical protein
MVNISTRVGLLVAAIALGASAFGHTAIANAEFNVETYDDCMRQPHVEDSEETYHAACCLLAHGTWDQNTHKCAAIDSDRITQNIQNIPLQPKLGSTPQPIPPTNGLGAPVS